MSDIDLIQACKKGDSKAQKALFYKHSKILFSVAIRYCKSNEDAEDVLQEAWVKIFNGINKYKEQGKFLPWMKTIVINNAIRSSQNKWFKTDLNIDIQVDLMEDPKVLNELSTQEVNQFINQLPDGYNQIFKMHVLDGFKHDEIGEIMGIKASTSRAKLTMARKKLKHLILTTNKVFG